MPNLKTPALVVLLACVLFSCNRRHAYSPTAIAEPMFTQKYEADINISFHPSRTGNLTAAFSITDHLALTSSLASKSHSRERKCLPGNSSTKLTSWGFGLGYFSPFKEDGASYWDCYVGYDNTKLLENYSFKTEFNTDENVTSSRLYIQPGIYNTRKQIDVGFATRISYLNHTFRFSEFDVPEPTTYGFDLFVTPVMSVTMGAPFVRFSFQLGLPLRLMDNSSLANPGAYASFGLNIHISRRWMEKKAVE